MPTVINVIHIIELNDSELLELFNTLLAIKKANKALR